MAQKEVKLEGVDKPQLDKGIVGNDAVVITEPNKSYTNVVTVDEVKEIAKKEEEGEIITENVYAKNIFAYEELEIANGGDLGTNLKAKVEELSSDTDYIQSETKVGGSNVMFAKFNPTGHVDNHWHIVNTKVDDNFIILGGLQVGTLAVHDISSIGSTATHDDLLVILQAIASSKIISYEGTIVEPVYYKPYDTSSTNDVVLILQQVEFNASGEVQALEKFTFTKQADGSLAVTHVSI